MAIVISRDRKNRYPVSKLQLQYRSVCSRESVCALSTAIILSELYFLAHYMFYTYCSRYISVNIVIWTNVKEILQKQKRYPERYHNVLFCILKNCTTALNNNQNSHAAQIIARSRTPYPCRYRVPAHRCRSAQSETRRRNPPPLQRDSRFGSCKSTRTRFRKTLRSARPI